MYLDKALQLFETLKIRIVQSLPELKENIFHIDENINILRGHAFEDELVNDTLETPFHEVSLCGNKVGDSLQILRPIWIGARNVHAVGHYDSQHNYTCKSGDSRNSFWHPVGNRYLYVYDRISGTTDN